MSLEDFTVNEYHARLQRAQQRMGEEGLDALVVTSPQNVFYFSGFKTQFWESPTRPWFVIVPARGDLIAVVPTIGEAPFAATHIRDIRTWPAPCPEDDGVSLLAKTLGELPRQSGRIGWEMGRESIIRMPIADFDRLRSMASGLEFTDGSPVIWDLRMVKSAVEIAHIRQSCQLASDAFAALPQRVFLGMSEAEVARQFRLELLERGLEHIPFMSVVASPGGYDQIIVGSRPRPLQEGDVLFIDLGATMNGYFCDFDRNYAVGDLDDASKRAQDTVWQATQAGIDAARPGATPADLFDAMMVVLGAAGDESVGRLGHGLGLHLTEPPSNRPGETVLLKPGMVMTIEPGMEFEPGRMLVHEENIVITENGCELLTKRAPRQMWRIS